MTIKLWKTWKNKAILIFWSCHLPKTNITDDLVAEVLGRITQNPMLKVIDARCRDCSVVKSTNFSFSEQNMGEGILSG